MSLEAIEQECVEYLQQTSNPLVPVSQLLRRIREDDAFAGITEKELVGFLRKHELFRVIDPLSTSASRKAQDLDDAGLPTTVSVMLAARIPTPAQLAEQMRAQMERLNQALHSALREAKESGDSDNARQIIEILSKAQELRQELDKTF